VPESPRWLVSKGRETQALKTLAYYHADGDENDPLVRYELEEIKAQIDFDRTVAANVGVSSSARHRQPGLPLTSPLVQVTLHDDW
jgi:hypothetical protein